MKNLVSFLTALLFAAAVQGQNPCNVVITGDFDSECTYDFKDVPYDEYPTLLVACEHSRVTYTATVDPALTVVSCAWTVVGADSYSAAGSQVVVDWGSAALCQLVATVTLADGTVCTATARVKLIATPTAAATTVPAYSVDASGDKVIRVCKGSRVEFLDCSTSDGSDIAGYHWSCTQAPGSATPRYVIDNVQADDKVYHRVYNNCGCYDEERYRIEVLEGERLEVDCYGTVCEGAVVTYTATNPSCDEYLWHVEGGTLVDGQQSSTPTVQWDRPHSGSGVLSLDGVRCGGETCPSMLSVRVPVIQDGLRIEGPQRVCLGESVLYSLPLFGSTRYDWSITPAADMESDMEHGNEMRLTFTAAGTYRIRATYRCDFLGCGPYESQELVVTVRPVLAIEGSDRICVTNPSDLHTFPAVSATWQAYDLDNGNAPVGPVVTGTAYQETFSNAGHYLVTADHPDYCGPASFVLTVKDVPPAPTVDELSPTNLHTACLNGGICLTGTPSEPHYSLVWAPACSTAAPQTYSGDSVNISYTTDVCDVWVYHYDRVLQCQSTGYYVHTVSALAPAPTSLPSSITVCPNSIVSFNSEVADQRADGVLYEWKIQNNMQHCASVRGSHQLPSVDLLINDLNATDPYTFYVELTRSYCNNQSVTDRVYITVRTDLNPTLSITGPTDVCVGESAPYTLAGCPPDDITTICTFPQAGIQNLELQCNPYDYCDNKSLYRSASITVNVHALPQAQITYDESTNTLTVNTGSGVYTYDWRFTDVYGVTNPASLGTTNAIQPLSSGYYRCTVTDQTPCSVTLVYYIGPTETCEPMALSHSAYDHCTNTIRITSPIHSHTVSWSVDGGEYEVQKSGDHSYIAEITAKDVGQYTVCASTRQTFPTLSCYKGCYSFNVDFVQGFAFSPACDKIHIINKSKYINGLNYVFMTVTNNCNNMVEYISFPVSQDVYTYIPNPAPSGECTYTFSLTGYGTDGNISDCTLRSVTIGGPNHMAEYVSISTNNPYDGNAVCDNTPILLTASLNYAGAFIQNSTWHFGDNGSYRTDGNSIYHTFKHKNGHYSVSVTVTDSRGCTRSTSTPLQINSYSDNLASGGLGISGSPICPHITPPGKEINFSPHVASQNHYTWASPLTGSSYQNYVSEPDIYRVSVVNNYFCQKEGAKFVPFLPCPTARIYAENYNCCAGQPLPLYGSMAPATGMQYQWAVSKAGGGYNEVFNTGDIVFIPPTAGTYNVALTVTDLGSTCSSTTHATVVAHAQPAAPTLAFASNSCLADAPLLLTATGYSGELHWSNGHTGASAYYSTPGIATAYCYDPAIGCPSLKGSLRIHHQPDFDALLTGCIDRCTKGISDLLPVYSLTPDRIDWVWTRDGNPVASDNDAEMYLQLPYTTAPGTYNLEVDYQNGGCHATSPDLVIHTKDTCDCEGIVIDKLEVVSNVEECMVIYTVTVNLCSENHDSVCFNALRVLSDAGNIRIDSVNYIPLAGAADCESIKFTLEATGLIPQNVLLQLKDTACMHCTKQLSIDLMPKVDCEKQLDETAVELMLEFSDEAALYYYYAITLPDECTLLAFWTEPAMVLDQNYDPTTGILEGLCMFDRAAISRMADTGGILCFRILLCCDDTLCFYTYCVKAEQLMDAVERGDGGDESEMYSTRPDNPQTDGKVSLAGNPASGEVTVVGTHDEVTEVLVMDMHGRRVMRHAGGPVFNVSSLAAGTYIVRVATRTVDSADRHHYLKLVKK